MCRRLPQTSLEVTRLSETNSTSRVGDCPGVPCYWMYRPASTRLRRERPASPGAERLPGRKRVLIRHRRRCAAVTLQDLTSNGVELAAEADPRGSLNQDCDRQCRQ